MSGVLLKLTVKDKPPCSKKVPMSGKDGKWDPRGEGNKATADMRQTGS